MGERGEALIIVIVIIISVGLLFGYPLMTIADRADDISQSKAQAATAEYVDTICSTGKFTPEAYSAYRQELSSDGNLYDVEIVVKVLDENPGKKSVQTTREKIGENWYYYIYTAQVLDVIDPDSGTPQTYYLKEGDIVSIQYKNSSPTMSQQLNSGFYSVLGDNTYTNSGGSSGMVRTTGN